MTSDKNIIEIEGQKYIIPSVYKNGHLVSDYANKQSLPIPITKGLHILRKRPPAEMPKQTLKQRIVSFFTL